MLATFSIIWKHGNEEDENKVVLLAYQIDRTTI